MLDIGPSR